MAADQSVNSNITSFMDISQISDIHSISQISHSSGRIIGRIDSLQSLFEHHCSTVYNASRSTVNSNHALNHLDKITKSFDLCEESMSDFAKNEIVFNCLVEAANTSNKALPEEIVEKLRGILLIYELDKYMHLPLRSIAVEEELTVLGITDLPKYELTYEEKLNLKCYVETLLRDKLHDFILRYESLGGNMKETLRGTDGNAIKELLETSDSRKLQSMNKMKELCADYEADIKKYKRLISEWNKLKYNDMYAINIKKAGHLLLRAEVVLQQAKITTLSSYIRMFKETPTTISAFQMLNDILDNKLQKALNEMSEKLNLKKQYDSVRDTEYDEILRTYLDVCKAIKKKKQILQNL